MNLSGSGVSFSVGPRGASVTMGSRGTFVNAGLPGTGFYSRERVGGSRQSAAPRRGANKVTLAALVKVDDDGTITFTDKDGAPLSEYLIAEAKKQNRDVILQTIQSTCDQINEKVEAVGQVHLGTPSPHERPTYTGVPFDIPPPARPTPEKPGFLASLFRGKREEIERRNADAQRAHEAAMTEWRRAKTEHDEQQISHRKFVDQDIYVDLNAMEQYLEGVLAEIDWPRETQVSFEIENDGAKTMVDVDLPEFEDMPTKTATVPQRGLKLTVKELPATKVRRLYMDHVHGVVFRVIGETFASLPTAQTVVVSGYSQRPDKSTGQIADEYLLSVRVPRVAWGEIDFSNLSAIDVVEALARFDLRRDVTKTAVFNPIEPFPT
jgi:hypothetical protein